MKLNSLKSEWVENKWWLYDVTFPSPSHEPWQRIFLCFIGLDYKARIFLNRNELCIHEGMFLPLELDITEYLAKDSLNTLYVLFEECPREMGLGITSQVHTQKSRFGYKWDFGTRLVNIGIWQDVFLKKTGKSRLSDVYVRTDYIGNKGSILVSAEAQEGKAEICLYAPDGLLLQKSMVCSQNGISQEFQIENPQLWYPFQLGEQPLYKVSIRLYLDGRLSDEKEISIGIRNLAFIPNQDAPPDALPYTVVFNGQKVYLKGVNLTPFDHMYGCVTEKDYKDYILLLKNCNINLVRIWGGGIIEKECFYRLCDENGILIWQEFIQSSSGVENVPPTNTAFLKLLEETATCVVKQKRNHVSLICWCGGNELRERLDDDTPVTFQNKNIALLRGIVQQYDDRRMFFPSSASGPFEFVTCPSGHDVHGLWRYEGTTKHYTLYNKADNLLHSEFGVDGMSSMDSIRYITNEENPPIDDMQNNLVWRFHGEWWDNLDKNQKLFGQFDSLEQFIACSQLMQGGGCRYIAEANRRRAFHNSGSIVWQFNEPWPNVSCTNLVEYSKRPKAAYYFLKRAYAQVCASLRYDTINPIPCKKYQYKVFLSSFVQFGVYTVAYEILDSAGSRLAGEQCEIEVEYAKPAEVFALNYVTPQTWDGLFFIRLSVIEKGLKVFENTYFFSSKQGVAPFMSMLRCPCSLTVRRTENTYTITNRGDAVALYVHPYLEDGNEVFDDCWSCLFPGESRSFTHLMPVRRSITFQAVNNIGGKTI